MHIGHFTYTSLLHTRRTHATYIGTFFMTSFSSIQLYYPHPLDNISLPLFAHTHIEPHTHTFQAMLILSFDVERLNGLVAHSSVTQTLSGKRAGAHMCKHQLPAAKIKWTVQPPKALGVHMNCPITNSNLIS